MKTTATSVLTTTDIRAILGVSKKTVSEWKSKGVLRPTSGGDGTGNAGLYSVRDVLAFAIGLNLRRRGFSVSKSGRVVNLLLARSLESLAADWQQGRQLLVVVGDRVLPAQLTHQQVYDNPEVDLPSIFGLGVPVAIVDVAAAHLRLLQRLVETRHEPEPPTGNVPSRELAAT